MKLLDRGKRVVLEAVDDNITGEAAKATYYFFLSLFPMILVTFALTGMLGGEAAFDHIMAWLGSAMPDEATTMLEAVVREVTHQRNPGALSIGLVMTLWAASNYFAALGDALDTMFGVRDRSSWLRKRLKAFLLMVLGAGLLIGSAVALLAGPEITHALGIRQFFAWLAWPLVFAALVGLFWLTYYILPAHDQASIRRELLIGAVVGTGLWLLATVLFRLYVSGIADFGRMYGFIGGIIVLLLWLYITTLAVLLGAEVAHVLAEEEGAAVLSTTA
jgi:membrane protein